MEIFWNWIMGSVLVGMGAISMGCGSGMMWRAWKAVSPKSVITVEKMNFIPSGMPVNGFVYLTDSSGQTYRFKVVDGRKSDS